jgi:GT2 family glycosyltransferase
LIRDRFSSNKNCIIICSKDNSHILKYCLNKIKENNIDQYNDILLVDDRSVSKDILNLSDEFSTSYLRIENTSNIFNYSMINNIAAMFACNRNKELLIFYNNDLWPENENTLPNIIEKHKQSKASITGCRLVYPQKKHYEELGKPQHLLSEHMDMLYNTIQHGGIFFYPVQNHKYPGPRHLWRFYEKNTPMATYNTSCFAVTGALHVINTKDFFDIKGLPISMGISFQDIAICIEACLNNKTVYYVGSEYMYHGESLTNVVEKTNSCSEQTSDFIFWQYLYGPYIDNLIGYQKLNYSTS